MPQARYQRIPTTETDPSDQSTTQLEDITNDDRPLRASVEAEFNRQPPPWWKRALLIAFLVALIWLSSRLAMGNPKPQVIYASRYSEEHKYRPAASPVITETLKDGRIRIRGASIGAYGVRDEDIPESPAEKRAKEEKRRKEARDAAKAKLGLKSRRPKSKKGKKVSGEH